MKSENRVHFCWLFVVSSLWLGYCNLVSAESDPNFPFTIEESKFLFNGEEVFLNIICYSPIEPGEDYDGKISAERLRDDLRRLADYNDVADPIVVRIYPGPTEDEPNRIPEFFYEEVRKLGFWIIRDIYFDENFCDPNYPVKGHRAIDSVIAEVNDANALDLIFAWELGNEFVAKDSYCKSRYLIEQFLTDMCSYLKGEISNLERDDVSTWVTWGSWPPYDPLHTNGVWSPIRPDGLDYISYNAYSYWPEQIQNHQPGSVTGTPYQGYLAALKNYYQTQTPGKPVVISEVGFSDSNRVIEASRCHPWYPAYRYGAMTPEQVAEGLVERYFDARLLRDDGDPNMVIAGLAVFSWNDEWWKFEDGELYIQEDEPEEHFGIGKFEKKDGEESYQLRYKLQQETVRDLYTLRFSNDANIIEGLVADCNTLSVDANTWVHAVISDTAPTPVRLRWETNRGYIIGDPNSSYDPNKLGEPNSVKYYSGKVWLGPATITAVAIDANGNMDRATTNIDIESTEPNRIEILTLGPGLETGKASGRVHNVDLSLYKLVCYLYSPKDDKFSIQPFDDMNSIWINKEGYWWTRVHNPYEDELKKLFCWVVPQDYEAPDYVEGWAEPNWSPDCNYIAEANTVALDVNDYNDVDNDLLPDVCEPNMAQDRYDDPDGDGANNLEEFLAGTSMVDGNDNDSDGDGLIDNWERRFFGDPNFYDANDDPDGDGLTNSEELALGLHPVRMAADKDRDGLPDLWEVRWFGNVNEQDANDDPDFDECTNLDEYELGFHPDCILVANLNCDCIVNLADYSVFAPHWQKDSNDPNWCDKADLYQNGKVDWYDLRVLAENWLMEL